jgi:predicted O-methyltransferase YrrM
MRFWTKSETQILAAYAAWLCAAATCAHLWLSPALAASTVAVAAALGLGQLVLSVRRQLVVWLEYERGQQQAIAAIHSVLPLRAPLPTLTRWASTPRLLAEVLQCVTRAAQAHSPDRPLTVLECGSGASTLAVGYWLQARGTGRIVSLDHDVRYAEQTREQAALHGIGQCVEVLHAPLVSQTIAGKLYPWYDLSALALAGPIDVLVVDGPPSATHEQARYPAFPMLERQLADEAFIVVDDVERPDERAAVERWVRDAEGRLSVEYSLEGRGFAVARYRRRPASVAEGKR